MSIFKKLAVTVFDVVTVPVAVVKDVFTMGGINTNRSKTYTADKLGVLSQDIDDIEEELRKS